MSSDAAPLIELRGVQRQFQVGDETVHALRDIDLLVERGEYIALMGPSGSGKSTLLNLLGLLDRPSGGHYFLAGRDTTTLGDAEQARTRAADIGFVFQFFHLVPRLSAQENVELPLLLAGVAPSERRERSGDILERLGIADRATHRPDQLSGGQRQRVAIARSTIMRPAVLLADEPTGNLDSKSGAEVIAILEKLNEDGLTLILVTHDPVIGDRARRRLQMMDGCIADDVRRDG